MSEPATFARPPRERTPAWVVTFADLMSLLLSFFVLLLSFSELDVLKFKQIAGSLAYAFGVQREIEAAEVPKGTSVIAREFSPGRPDPSAVAEVRQRTTETPERFLETHEAGETPMPAPAADPHGRAKADAERLREALRPEIDSGLIDIERRRERVVIRIREKGSFPSGSAVIEKDFEPVLTRVGRVLAPADGRIVVAGHTDDVPIATSRFRSNWELSAARAASVLHHLVDAAAIEESRLLIEAYADSRPLGPNDGPANRARNRRVEIILLGEERGEAAAAGAPVLQALEE